MSIADKAIETVTKNVSLSIQLKDAEAKIAILQQENSDLKLSLRQVEDKAQSLENKIVELQSNPLLFDDKTGTFLSSYDGLRYCAKCKASGSLSPMTNCEHGWKCPVCNSYAADPKRPEPPFCQPTRTRTWR